MKQDQMWIVKIKKAAYLDEREVLATADTLTTVVERLIQTYDKWEVIDSITIKPTEMTYCG